MEIFETRMAIRKIAPENTWAREQESVNNALSEEIYKFLLKKGEAKDEFLLSKHFREITLRDGRKATVTAQTLNGLDTWEKVGKNPHHCNYLSIEIESPREGVVGYSVSQRVDNHDIDHYRVKTGPGVDSCFSIEMGNSLTVKEQMIRDYGKVLRSVSKALGITTLPSKGIEEASRQR